MQHPAPRSTGGLLPQLRALWAIWRKDLAVFFRSPAVIASTLLPSITVMILLAIEATAVGSDPIALVNQSHGPLAAALASSIQASPYYRVVQTTAQAAHHLYQTLAVSAVITIPPGFDAAIRHGQVVHLPYRINNLSQDSTNDLLRSLPTVLEGFLRRHHLWADHVVRIRILPMHAVTATFVGFELIAVLIMLLLQSALLSSGQAAVREWEDRSIKEILLSPARPTTIVLGKVLAGVTTSWLFAGAVGTLAILGGLLPLPTWSGLSLAAVVVTLVALFGAGLGIGLAAVLRSLDRLSAIAINLAFYLFFLSGGMVSLPLLPGWVRTIARAMPNTYGSDALRQTLLYHSGTGVLPDIGVLLAAGLLALVFGIRMLGRSLAVQ